MREGSAYDFLSPLSSNARGTRPEVGDTVVCGRLFETQRATYYFRNPRRFRPAAARRGVDTISGTARKLDERAQAFGKPHRACGADAHAGGGHTGSNGFREGRTIQHTGAIGARMGRDAGRGSEEHESSVAPIRRQIGAAFDRGRYAFAS